MMWNRLDKPLSKRFSKADIPQRNVHEMLFIETNRFCFSDDLNPETK